MADSKLSALTAATSVADADLLYVAQGGVSKKATASLVKTYIETGGTVTASDPALDLSQTWNNGAVAFTSFRVNATSSASAAASLVADFQADSASVFSIGKLGVIGLSGTSTYINGYSGDFDLGTSGDFIFKYDGASSQFAEFSGFNKNLRIFGTRTDSSNYDGIAINADAAGNYVQVAAVTAGTGADDIPVSITPAGAAGVILGAPGNGAASSTNHYNKSVTGIADATATNIFTVTVPNAAHSASIEVVLTCSLGAGGAIGANEATGTVVYNVSVARTAGVAAVATISTAYGSSTSSVAGAATITVTGDLGAVSGAVGATNTFTIRATVTRGSGSSTNHTCVATARLLNANASGITIS